MLILLEIIVVIALCSALNAKLKRKGRSGWWTSIGVLTWIVGEFAGGFVYGLLVAAGKVQESNVIFLISAMGTAAVCMAGTFMFVNIMPSKSISCPQCGGPFVQDLNSARPRKICNSCIAKARQAV